MQLVPSRIADLSRGDLSGKSTLLRCINLLEPIDDGRILLDGDEISEPGRRPDAFRRRIGIVFQSFNLFPHLSVLANVTLAPKTVLKLPRSRAEAEARTLLARFGLADRADPPVPPARPAPLVSPVAVTTGDVVGRWSR